MFRQADYYAKIPSQLRFLGFGRAFLFFAKIAVRQVVQTGYFIYILYQYLENHQLKKS